MAIYKAVNRGHTRSVVDNCSAAQPKAQELVDLLDSGGPGDRSVDPGRGQEQLRKELLAEAHALREVYGGIKQAAAALAAHEDAIRKYYDDHPGRVTRQAPRPHPGLHRPGRRPCRGGRRSGRAPVLAGPPADQRPGGRAAPGEDHYRPS